MAILAKNTLSGFNDYRINIVDASLPFLYFRALVEFDVHRLRRRVDTMSMPWPRRVTKAPLMPLVYRRYRPADARARPDKVIER